MNTLNNDDVLSKTITFLRFPLIVLVVFIHTDLMNVVINGRSLIEEGQFPVYDLFHHVITNELATIAVPLFFFISGFLFFYRTDFSIMIYGVKLKKRVKTLLIPYLFWNIMVAFMLLGTHLFFSPMTSGRNTSILGHDFGDWLNLFWNYQDGYPVCYQFWFIRDLMVVMVCSPLVYYYIKYCKLLGLIVLGILWVLNFNLDIPGISIVSFSFFSFGAWFSINKCNFAIYFRTKFLATIIFYMILVVIGTLLWYNKTIEYSFVYNITILVGVIAIVGGTALGIERMKICPNYFLTKSSFFIYAFHGLPVVLMLKYWVKLIQPFSETTMLTGYFFIPVLIILLGIGIYIIMKKFVPSFTEFIIGNR